MGFFLTNGSKNSNISLQFLTLPQNQQSGARIEEGGAEGAGEAGEAGEAGGAGEAEGAGEEEEEEEISIPCSLFPVPCSLFPLNS